MRGEVFCGWVVWGGQWLDALNDPVGTGAHKLTRKCCSRLANSCTSASALFRCVFTSTITCDRFTGLLKISCAMSGVADSVGADCFAIAKQEGVALCSRGNTAVSETANKKVCHLSLSISLGDCCSGSTARLGEGAAFDCWNT